MRLVLTLLCRDEIDIIAAMLNYHLANGVDQIIATDNGSVDGTLEILEKYTKSGRLILIREPRYTHEQSLWVTRMAKIAHSECGADWVINSDADEFWWPSAGNLKTILSGVPPMVDAVTVTRRNFLPRPVEAERNIAFYERMVVRERVSFNSLGMQLPGKVCHRAKGDTLVAPGNHSVSFCGAAADKFVCSQMEILHFPVRSYEQYETKIRQGSQALLNNIRRKENEGRTWLHIYENIYRRGRLRDYFESLVASEEEIKRRLAAGDLAIDERLAIFFRNRLPECLLDRLAAVPE